jgi:hypothetical protein
MRASERPHRASGEVNDSAKMRSTAVAVVEGRAPADGEQLGGGPDRGIDAAVDVGAAEAVGGVLDVADPGGDTDVGHGALPSLSTYW